MRAQQISSLQLLLDDYSTGWGPIEWRQHQSALKIHEDDSMRRLFVALSVVEEVAAYMATLIRIGGIDQLAPLRDFTTIWLAEESEHGRALSEIAKSYGATPEELQQPSQTLRRMRDALTARPFLMASRRFFPSGVVGLYLALGAVQEYITMSAYDEVRRIESLGTARATIVGSISQQEARHMRFYQRAARFVLSEVPGASKFVRRYFARAWSPPGLGVLGEQRWLADFEPILTTDGLARLLRVDSAVLPSLPGLEGLRPMERFLTRRGLVVTN